jgi:hypothetical protein
MLQNFNKYTQAAGENFIELFLKLMNWMFSG